MDQKIYIFEKDYLVGHICLISNILIQKRFEYNTRCVSTKSCSCAIQSGNIVDNWFISISYTADESDGKYNALLTRQYLLVCSNTSGMTLEA